MADKIDALPYDDELNYLYDEVSRVRRAIFLLCIALSLHIIGAYLNERKLRHGR